MSKVLIIEPHADDALFSLYSIMQKLSDKSIDVLTCCTHPPTDGRSSAKLVEYIPQISKVTTLSYTEDKFLWSTKPYTHYDINRLAKNPEIDTYKYTVNALVHNKTMSYSQGLSDMTKLIQDYLSSNQKYSVIYIPIGIVHPYHILVTNAVLNLSNKLESDLIFYAERPYSCKKYVQRIISDFVSHHLPEDYSKLELTYDGKSKEQVINKVYPGELNNFHWDLANLLEVPELIFAKDIKPIKVEYLESN